MPAITTLHILPLQLNLRSDLGIDIVCDDPLARVDDRTGILTVLLPVNPRAPRLGQERVRFVARDPAPFSDVHNYASVLSGSPPERFLHWFKEGVVSRSPYFTIPATLEIWATVLSIPSGGDATAAKVYKGRRNVVIDYQGGGDLDIL